MTKKAYLTSTKGRTSNFGWGRNSKSTTKGVSFEELALMVSFSYGEFTIPSESPSTKSGTVSVGNNRGQRSGRIINNRTMNTSALDSDPKANTNQRDINAIANDILKKSGERTKIPAFDKPNFNGKNFSDLGENKRFQREKNNFQVSFTLFREAVLTMDVCVNKLTKEISLD